MSWIGGSTRRTMLALVVLVTVATAACAGGEPASSTEVVPSEAYKAVVGWEVDNQEPILDENGEIELPVIYVAAVTGETIDVGVQASVAESTAEVAIVRFADDSSEAIDDTTSALPVKDNGVLLIVGEVPEPERTIEVLIVRYRSADDELSMTVEITASTDGAQVTKALSN